MKDQILLTLSSVDRVGIPNLMDYLRRSDFFDAPASTKFHLSVPGGLAQHSWNVFQCLKGLDAKYSLGFHSNSIAICGLLHDMCKIGLYRREMKRARTPDGKWIDEEQWVHRDEYPLGHGEKSLSMIQEFIKLSKQEAMAIRWHMGPWDAEGYSARKSMGQAMDMYPMVKAMMLADQTASWMVEANHEIHN